MMMVLPGFGEIFVPARVRLTIALVITYVLLPVLSEKLPGMPENGIQLGLLLLAEVLLGALVGGLARLLQSILHISGMIMAFLSSLAAS